MAEEAREPAARTVDTGDGPDPGAGLVKLAIVGTGALVATSVAAAAAPATFGAVHAVLSVVLFVVGTGAMLWAYGLGVSPEPHRARRDPRAVLPRRRRRPAVRAPGAPRSDGGRGRGGGRRPPRSVPTPRWPSGSSPPCSGWG